MIFWCFLGFFAGHTAKNSHFRAPHHDIPVPVARYTSLFFKKLELHGFKSFGHKTSIDFQDGFTIVVGPNGCGKSNVLDGIRWVLGSQSAKSMRGEKMGDVIFRGSQSTKAAGMSAVTLTLNNERGHLKMDQSEVAVTRRLFANGDSEYQLNKKNCRMRDVHEVFLDTGLGADGYSIIEQNAIGQMVSAKPRERREVFEEAAGISRYKLRREETLRKLTRTSEDLIRLEDMVSEVERQCNSLRNQARKAKRHRKLTRRLHRLQQRLYVMRHDDLSTKYESASTDLKEKQSAFESIFAEAGKAEAEISALQEQFQEAQNKFQELQQRRHDLQTQRDAERHQMELAQEKIRTIDERLDSIAREDESRQSRLKVLESTITALEQDFQRDEDKLQEEQRVLDQKAQELEVLKSKSVQAKAEVAVSQTKLRQLQQQQNTLEHDAKLAENLIDRLTNDLQQTTDRLTWLRERLSVVENEYETAKTRVEKTRNELDELRSEAHSIKQEIEQGDQAKNELSEKINGLTHNLNQAASRLQALKELEESYAGYFQGVKEVMKASENGQLPGIIGVVSNLVQVPKNLELAVEVALGGDLQDIITDNVQNAKNAIAFLKRENLGHATFLALDFIDTRLNTGHLERIWGRNGVLGLGKDLVKYDQKIENAVINIFGNTVFVDNIDLAVSLEKEGIRNRFVSLDGDIVSPRGVLSGGSRKTRGLLSRNREIRDLEEKVKHFQGELNKLQEELRSAKDKLSERYARAAELQAETHKREMELAGLRKDLEQAERDRKEIRNQTAQSEARETQQKMDLQKQSEVMENSRGGLEQITEQLKVAEETAINTEKENADLLEAHRTASEEVAVLRQKLEQGRESLTVARQRLEEMQQSREESKSDQQKRLEETEFLDKEKTDAKVRFEEAEVSYREFAEAFQEADKFVSQSQQDHEVKQRELRDKTNESQKLIRDKNEKDNALREIQMASAELKAQLEYLEREVEDEFALTIDDVRKELKESEEAERIKLEEMEKAKEEAKEAEKQRRKEEREAQKAAKEAEAKAAEEAAANDAEQATAEGEEQSAEVTAEADSEDANSEENGAHLNGTNGTMPGAPLVAAAEAQDEEAKSEEDSDSDEENNSQEDDDDVELPVTTPEDDEADTPQKLRTIVNELRQKLQRMGSVNEDAIQEYAEQSERLEFLATQRDDLAKAKQQLEETIERIDETTTVMFSEAMDEIRANFKDMYSRLFNGGEADLIMVEDEKHPEPGIDIYAQPPGKKIGGSITLLSGGEKALTAIALMFALFQFRPSPICILDEIDAPLDDVNCHRMCQVLKQYASDTQFLVITHNKITMSLADTIYGVTMQEPGVSKLVSVKFQDVEDSGLLEAEPAKA